MCLQVMEGETARAEQPGPSCGKSKGKGEGEGVLITGSYDRTARVWDLETGEEVMVSFIHLSHSLLRRACSRAELEKLEPDELKLTSPSLPSFPRLLSGPSRSRSRNSSSSVRLCYPHHRKHGSYHEDLELENWSLRSSFSLLRARSVLVLGEQRN